MELTRSEQIILKFLSKHTGETLYESEIAKNAFISVGSANQCLRELNRKEMVELEKRGNMNFYSLNMENPLVRQFKITQVISQLNGLITKLKPLTDKLVLFGSCAEGLDTKDSDIDLAVVSGQVEMARKLIKGQKSDRQIQALIFSQSEFMALAEKDKPLYERIQKGIVLWRSG